MRTAALVIIIFVGVVGVLFALLLIWAMIWSAREERAMERELRDLEQRATQRFGRPTADGETYIEAQQTNPRRIGR